MPNNLKDLTYILKKARKDLKISQSKLAEGLDVSHTTISRIERGETNVPIELFISLANSLGYDLTLQRIGEYDNVIESLERDGSEYILETMIKNCYEVINDDKNIFDKDVLILKKKRTIRKR